MVGLAVLLGIWLWGRWRRSRGDDLDDLLDDTDWMEEVARQTRRQRGEPETLVEDPHPEALQDAFESALYRDAPHEPPLMETPYAPESDVDVAPEDLPGPMSEPDLETEPGPDPSRIRTEPPASRAVREPNPAPEPAPEPAPDLEADPEPAPQRPERSEGVVHPAGPDDLILALFVMAPQGAAVPGPALESVLRDSGLRFGEMDIYHWFHQGDSGPPEAVFSVASMVEPGTLERVLEPDFHTPGLALFMSLPGPVAGSEGFEAMLATGRRLAEALGGELKDERRSTLTLQTVGHIRDRVRDHEVRRRTGRSG